RRDHDHHRFAGPHCSTRSRIRATTRARDEALRQRADRRASVESRAPSQMTMHPQTGQDIHRFIFETSSQLRNAGDPDKILKHYLRATVNFMQADSGYVATLGVGYEAARSVFAQPADASANLALVTDLLRGKHRTIPAGT